MIISACYLHKLLISKILKHRRSHFLKPSEVEVGRSWHIHLLKKQQIRIVNIVLWYFNDTRYLIIKVDPNSFIFNRMFTFSHAGIMPRLAIADMPYKCKELVQLASVIKRITADIEILLPLQSYIEFYQVALACISELFHMKHQYVWNGLDHRLQSLDIVLALIAFHLNFLRLFEQV